MKQKRLYSNGEEIFNGVSHIVGGGLGIIFMIISIVLSSIYKDNIAILAMVIYGISMIILYTMSSLYHMLKPKTAKKVFQIFDHCSIFILIAGTYTPYMLIALNNQIGYIILAIVWSLTIIGIVFNAINMDWKLVKILSYISYILMGWCVVFAIEDLINSISFSCLLFLVCGGIFYTIGFIFYILGKNKKWFHSIWHLFVLAGTILHFISIIFLIIP